MENERFTSDQRDKIEKQLREKGITDVTDVDTFLEKSSSLKVGEYIEIQYKDVVVKIPGPSQETINEISVKSAPYVVGGALVAAGAALTAIIKKYLEKPWYKFW